MNLLIALKTRLARNYLHLLVFTGLSLGIAGIMLVIAGQNKQHLQTPVNFSQSEESSKLLIQQLSDIQVQLASLKKEIKKPANPVNLTPIQQELYKLGRVVESVKAKEAGTAEKLFGENKALTEKLEAVNLTLAQLNQAQTPVNYLESKVLPFKVMAIDNIQEQAVLAIEYNFHPLALEKGDEVAGWKVVSLDYSKQLAEFENKDKAHVQLALATIG